MHNFNVHSYFDDITHSYTTFLLIHNLKEVALAHITSTTALQMTRKRQKKEIKKGK
jgi:hypothetical protein